MTTSTTSVPVVARGIPGSESTSAAHRRRVTQRSVVRAEWIKFRSVRSNIVGLAASGAVLVLFGMLFASIAGSGGESGPPRPGTGDALSTVFGGMTLSQLVIGLLAAVFVAGEYSTGLIRTMFGIVPSRVPVLRAKAIVVGGANWVVMTVASFAVFFAGQAVYTGDATTFSITDDGVLRAVLGGGLYGAGVAVFGLALGFLLRSTAAAIGVLVGLFFLGPVLIGLVPGGIGDTITELLPSNAGSAFMSVTASDELLSPAAGLVVFAVWVFGAIAAASLTIRHRDA